MGPSKGSMNSQGVENGSGNNHGVGECLLLGLKGPLKFWIIICKDLKNPIVTCINNYVE